MKKRRGNVRIRGREYHPTEKLWNHALTGRAQKYLGLPTMTTKVKKKSFMPDRAVIQGRKKKKKKTIPVCKEGLIPGISKSREVNNVPKYFFLL